MLRIELIGRSQVPLLNLLLQGSKIADIFNVVSFSEYAVLLFVTGRSEGLIYPSNADGEYRYVFLGPETSVYTRGLPAPDDLQ